MQNKIWQSRCNAMKLPWRKARNLNRIGGSMKRAQEVCRGRECVNNRNRIICHWKHKLFTLKTNRHGFM